MLKDENKQLSIVIPTLNEFGNIKNLISRIDEALRRDGIDYELIFIDDHSIDGTFDRINQFSAEFPVQVHLKKGQKGKAFSLWEGFEYVKYSNIAIIDADLQYPPEAIPKMLEEIDKGFGVVVASRVEHDTPFLRKIASFVFRLIFGRMLHGLNCDVQSGLKVFKKEITEKITVNPTPWSFDLEFLIGAKRLGYKIGTTDIVFAERQSGVAKVNLLKVTFELALNSIKLKFRDFYPTVFKGSGPKMIGSGVVLGGNKFITHSNLDPQMSAAKTFTVRQKLIIFFAIAALSIGFYLDPILTGIILMAFLSAVYLLDVIFNLFLVLKSLSNPPELSFTEEELAQVDETQLPIYSILCPLFRESEVLPSFIKAIENLDWPKEKLDVILLLEENDDETIDAARSTYLPPYIRTVIVPKSLPKTKPKACNYGLSMANGEFLTIYDAEDVPESSQLKKAYLGFKSLPDTVRCLQGKLNYFNPDQNLLTRLFTAEYSLWFDVVLPGLQSVNTSIPLGGTSNHFRTKDLIELGGWDPFNVTEDADLGVRLFKRGYRTAIIDSVTLEEANSNLKNWIRQRSRWVKGYMQTYLVHMRKPAEFFKKSGFHFFLFQLNVGGKIAFMLINPILWAATISYFTMRAIVGPTIESLYPTPVLYMAVSSLIFGNFFYFYYYLVGCAKRAQWHLIKYTFFIPFYWLFMSVAAVMALYELIVKPHYWQKTNHGLHLAKEKSVQPIKKPVPVQEKVIAEPIFSLAGANKTVSISPVIDLRPNTPPLWERLVPKRFLSNQNITRGGILIVAMMLSNLLNFVFNAFLGRVLTFEDFGLITLINTLWYVASIFMGGISSTINHRTAYLNASNKNKASIHFWRVTLRVSMLVAVFASVIWLFGVPFFSEFFNISNTTALLIFTPILSIGVIAAANRGFLQGNLMFQSTGSIYLSESIVKLVLALLFVYIGLHSFTYAVIPLSVIFSALVAHRITARMVKKLEVFENEETDYQFPRFFYLASIVSSISSAVFLSLDIILVKHFLAPELAGQYALLSLVGKMIYFFGSFPALFVITFVSRDEGLGRDSRNTFKNLFLLTLSMVAVGFVALSYFGQYTIPLLLGSKAEVILKYAGSYTLAISLFTLSNMIVSYHLAKKEYIYSFLSLLTSVFMAAGIMFYHDSISSVVKIIWEAGIFGIILIGGFHFIESKLPFIAYNLRDFFGIFVKHKEGLIRAGAKRILIFNWRDTKHRLNGGAEIYIHEMAKRLVTEGYNVTQFSGNDGHLPVYENVDGVNVIRRGGFYFVYIWAFFYYIFQFRGKFDIIIDCHNGIPFFTPLYANEKIYCVVHHIHQEIFRRYLPLPLAMFARFLERDLMPIVYRNVKFITVSDSTRKEMVEFGYGNGNNVEIVYNGVDLESYHPSNKSVDPVILFLGRLQPYKSIGILLNAFKIISQNIKDATLVIAGSGEDEKNLIKIAKELEIDKRVIFTGKVSNEDKIKYLQKAWVMVNPSLIEGWGITSIEASACGTPVIASDVPGLRESVRHLETGYLVKYGDSKAFAGKITEIINDQKLRNELAVKAREWAEKFSWENSYKKLSLILK